MLSLYLKITQLNMLSLFPLLSATTKKLLCAIPSLCRIFSLGPRRPVIKKSSKIKDHYLCLSVVKRLLHLYCYSLLSTHMVGAKAYQVLEYDRRALFEREYN